jgi:glutamine synthetase
LNGTVDALPTLKSKKAVKLFDKYGVLNKRELQARVDVLWEQYITIMAIEARTLVMLVRTQVLPASMRYQTEVAQAVSSAQAAGTDFEDTWGQLSEAVKMVDELRAAGQAVATLEAAMHEESDSERRALHVREKLIPAMNRTRAASDSLEAVVPGDLWTLPTYTQMLLQR